VARAPAPVAAAVERKRRRESKREVRRILIVMQASGSVAKIPALVRTDIDHDPIGNRIMISFFLSMIFSENRLPLFRIMLRKKI
jgi:hypothetical protein